MNKIYAMILVTVLFFLLSFDVIFYSNVYMDITLVLIYLLLVGQFSLNLDTSIEEGKETTIIGEKKTSLFAPMIIMPFLGMSYSFGLVFFIINILVIVLLYGYVFISLKRNKITVTNIGFSVVYLNNKQDSMLFSDVQRVDFNWVYNYIALYNSQGKKLILDITLKDFVVVIKAIKTNISSSLSSETFKKLSTFYKMFLVQSNTRYLS